MKLDQINSGVFPAKEMQTFYLLLDKSLSHINKQSIRRIKNISAAPPRISINSVPEAEEWESSNILLLKIRHKYCIR
jgi:hypothetical protein